MTSVENDYLEELDLFKKTLAVTGLISLNQQGIQTDGRGVRAVKIFTRQTLIALSLDKILPVPDKRKKGDEELWDIGSIASLSRNLVEGYLSLHYFGLENTSESDAELRFFILQLHRNVEWYNIRSGEMRPEELKQFDDGITEQKSRIRNHPFISKLTDQQRNNALRGFEMYKSKSDFEDDLLICKDLRKHYRLLSNLVHPLPLSIERTDNERGRGLNSEPDVGYCLNCLMLARKYLSASTVGVADRFPNELANRYSDEIKSIRPLQSEGFD